MKKLEEYIRTVPDFPKKGILFRDITAALGDKDGMQLCIDSLAELINDLDVDIIAGTESRGFILGAPLAYRLHKPFLTIRKKGKLPCETIEESYALEYGTATIEIDKSIVKPGDRVIIVDDLIATGGTMKASCKLVERCGGKVLAIVALIELVDLKGREFLGDYVLRSVLKYDGE